MTTVTAKFVDHKGDVLGEGATLEVWSPELTPDGDVSPKRSVVERVSVHNIADGVPVPPLDNLIGGPLFFFVNVGRFRRRYLVNVPKTGTHDFVDLVSETIPYEPWVAQKAGQYASQARESASDAAKSAGEAAAFEAQTLAYRNTAGTHATTATDKATEAATSASTANARATTATTEADRSKTEADRSKTEADRSDSRANASDESADQAAGFRDTASTHADTAGTQAGIATTRAGEASTHADRAEDARTGIEDARTATEGYRDTALSHKNAAATSATASADRAEDALAYRNTAGTHAETATTQAGIATTRATTATTQAGIATTKAGEADTSRATAAGHASAAGTSADEAAGSAAAASGHAVTAGGHATAAADSALTAEQTADLIVNVLADAQAYQNVLTALAGLEAEWQTDIDAAVAALVDQAPETLNTLAEVAAALGDDPNFATTVMDQIGQKVANNDPRLSDARTPLAHEHTMVQVTGLVAALAGKSDSGHGHTWAEIGGKPSAYPSTVALVAGLSDALANAGSNDAGELTGALTDQVDASAAMVPDPSTDFTIQYPLGTFVEQMATGLNDLFAAFSDFFAALAGKSDIGHTHSVTDLTATGTRSSSTYLRGDGSWATPANTTYTVPTQAEAEAGTATTGRAFSAQRAHQAAIAASGKKDWQGTQAQYDALGTKDADRTYWIV